MDSRDFLEALGDPNFLQGAQLPSGLCAGLVESLRASGLAVALFDPQDRLAFGGDMFAAIYNLQPGPQTFDDIMRRCHQTRTGPIFGARDINEWLATAHGKRRSAPQRRFEVDLLDGRWLLASETTYGAGWLLLTLTDITFLKASERTLRHARDIAVKAAETDFLTDLFNRRRMMEHLAECAKRSAHAESPLSVALVDLDHFKTINDAHGHAAGDKILCHFSDRARASLRKADTVGRVGGEEFMIILPSKRDDAVRIVERLRGRIARSKPLRGIDLHYTMSAGVASWRRGDSADTLYRRADEALYAAKRSGRNRVVACNAPAHSSRAA
jgi:diguanylate cyclase (GGDEF)-like protein